MSDEKKKLDTRQKIVEAARKEFSKEGYGGARMDRIAKNAGVNKAMIFYYFASKDNLYKSVLNEVMQKLFEPLADLMAKEERAEQFLESLPELQISFFARNPDFVRIVALDLLNNPQNVKDFFREFFSERYDRAPGLLLKRVKKWSKEGEIVETDPVQFIINIISLNIYFFIGKPIFEAALGMELKDDGKFYKKRIKSVVSLLQRGMLK